MGGFRRFAAAGLTFAALVSGVALTPLPAAAGGTGVTEPTAMPAGRYSLVDLGLGIIPTALNNDDQVSVTRRIDRGISGDRIDGGVWQDGALTILNGFGGPPDVNTGYPVAETADINDAGQVLGSAADSPTADFAHAARWAPGAYTSSPADLGILTPNHNNNSAGTDLDAAGASVSSSDIDDADGYPFNRAFYESASGGSPVEIGSGLGLSAHSEVYACGLSDDGHILVRVSGAAATDGTYVLAGPADTGTKLDYEPAGYCGNNQIGLAHPMAHDGTVVGDRYVSGVDQSIVRDPDGAERTCACDFDANSVNSDGDAVGYSFHFTDPASQTATVWTDDGLFDLSTNYSPSGWRLASASMINDHGDIAGWGYVGSGSSSTQHGFLLKANRATIKGTVRRGSAPGKPFTPTVPVRALAVAVDGTTSGGDPWSGTTTTAADGTYGIDAPPGTYSVEFPDGVCANPSGSDCETTAEVTVEAGAEGADPAAVTQDAVAVSGDLSVTVKLSAKTVTLTRDKKTGETDPKDVTATVTVTNTGAKAVKSVVAPDKLIIGYAKGTTPQVPTVPVKQTKGPTPVKPTAATTIKSLAPKKSATYTYVLHVKGDGKYDIDALFIGQDEHGRLLGLGKARLNVGAPILVTSFELGRHVKSPGAPKLVRAGTSYVIDADFENRSYTRSIVVTPLEAKCTGNASGCYLQGKDLPIQPISSLAAVQTSPWLVIEPRQTKHMELVVRTTNIPADVRLGHDEIAGGGTRSKVKIDDPKAYEWDGEKLGDKLTDKQAFTDGDQDYELGLDVRDFKGEPEAETIVGDLFYFSRGLIRGLWNVTGGAIISLVRSIPEIAHGIITHVPAALISYVQAEAELWDAIKDDPVQRAAFFNAVGNATLLSFRYAPGLIKNTQDLRDKVNAAVLAQYTKLWNDWYDGDWTEAMSDITQEGTERIADVALALAPGILARMPKVAEAFNARKAAIFAQISEDLSVYAGEKWASALEAVQVLADSVKPGFEFTDIQLRKLYGLTYEQAQYLRNFAAENKLLIVVRSRATESVKWIKKYGAVLKPESIKLKNVAWLDYKYLGYSRDDIGRVVLRYKLPSKAEVEAALHSNGFGAGDPEWVEALKRLTTREEELTKTKDGYALWMEQAAKDGHVDMKWNFAENSVDPTHYTDSTTRYRFRLNADGHGNHVPEFYVNGKWRSITGDVDFLQISHANGAALSDAERVAIYKKMANSVVGMLHPESATWTDIKNNVFDFATKTNEFIRGGTVAQFGPDGLARAVTFNEKLSSFASKTAYRIGWNGGYVTPLGPVAP